MAFNSYLALSLFGIPFKHDLPWHPAGRMSGCYWLADKAKLTWQTKSKARRVQARFSRLHYAVSSRCTWALGDLVIITDCSGPLALKIQCSQSTHAFRTARIWYYGEAWTSVPHDDYLLRKLPGPPPDRRDHLFRSAHLREQAPISIRALSINGLRQSIGLDPPTQKGTF